MSQMTKADADEVRRLALRGHTSLDQLSADNALRNLCCVLLFLAIRVTEDVTK